MLWVIENPAIFKIHLTFKKSTVLKYDDDLKVELMRDTIRIDCQVKMKEKVNESVHWRARN